ncbi:type II secretion system protein [bacterium CPR1]|nr:type II secretion system protein [bacterium CPR1]
MSRRGLTLFEVLVASVLLGGMMIASLIIYATGLSNQRKTDSQSDSYRAVMMAISHIRSELRGSQVLYPATDSGPQTIARYRYPRMNGNLPRVDPTGAPIWAGIGTFELRDGGKLTRVNPVDARTLAELGENGSIRFERPDHRLLRVTVVADRFPNDRRRKSHYEATVEIYLPNN